MKKPAKIALIIASVWPFGWMILFFVFMFGTMFFFSSTPKSAARGQGMPPAILFFFLAHFLTILLMFGLTAFYIVYLFRTDRITQDKKALWAIVLFMGNMLAFPVFWYLYIWKEPEITDSQLPSA
ncbi:MAG: hypothetical protein QOK37_1984 [Thermoanaerobaculia bacterium]|jgi:hypothetical protein|nr:hypothetical protein [Thermoanaerobaculia bacterium]